MENIFVEFLPPWVETGLQPAFYDKESGSVLQQTARMYARVNMLIRMFNKLSKNTKTTVEDYINQFNELHDYVHDYFNNLDVQEEINNKLDAMAEDGSLTALISAYVDPIYQSYENVINARIDHQDSELNNMNNNIAGIQHDVDVIDSKVESGTSGSPKGVYATLSALQSADPNHNYIYVVTADGKWYYYNTALSAWTAGGTYQSSQGVIAYEPTDNLVDITTIADGKFINANGTISDLAQAMTTDFIPVESEEKYTVLSPFMALAYYEADNSFISRVYNNNVPYAVPYTVTTPANTAYIRISFNHDAVTEPMMAAGEVTTKTYVSLNNKEVDGIDFSDTNYASLNTLVNNTLYDTDSINLINPADIVSGKYIVNQYGELGDGASYQTTGFIRIKPNTTYYMGTRNRQTLQFDQFQNAITSTYHNGWQDPASFTSHEDARFIRYAISATAEDIMMNEGSNPIAYQPYKRRINQTIPLTDKMKDELSSYRTVNLLTGKKLVACGDSFTQYTDEQFDSGIYAGENKVWPFLIALRNNMNVHNMAVSGSTMAVTSVSGQTNFADLLYTQIDADADYILIKYGINDEHTNVPIGTIDSNDDTTFYGAWNKVMSYIISNHPTAKIGLIVTNGLSLRTGEDNNNNYANATIEIAKKYGVPILNEWNDPNVPLLLRTGRTDVAQAIRDIRRDTFKVSAENLHENHVCQEYESTFIEDFLRRL